MNLHSLERQWSWEGYLLRLRSASSILFPSIQFYWDAHDFFDDAIFHSEHVFAISLKSKSIHQNRRIILLTYTQHRILVSYFMIN